MKSLWKYPPVLISCLAVLAAGAAVTVFQRPDKTAHPLEDILPAGPALVIKAADLAALLHDWNASPEKQRWVVSDNFAVFSRSRLFLRLQQAQREFAMAAGLPPDRSMLDSVAGTESALAVYDIGKLEFIYVTNLPSARTAGTSLWQKRGDFEARKAAGIDYFVRTDPASRRTVAFAASGDLLLLATREDLLAGALTLMTAGATGQSQIPVSREAWFSQAIHAAELESPDLRLVLNLPEIVRSPYFRSYWIQRNVRELRPYRSCLADVYRSSGEIRERRVLLRSRESAADGLGPDSGSQGGVLAELLKSVPAEVGFYCGWSQPRADEVLTRLERTVLAPHPSGAVPSESAPRVELTGAEVGTEGDLETRIDLAPLAGEGNEFSPAALRDLFTAAPPEALLEIEETRSAPDGIFVAVHSAIVIERPTAWDAKTVEAALRQSVEGLWTIAGLGADWSKRTQDGQAILALDGLTPLALALRGRLLVVGNDSVLVGSIASRLAEAQSESSLTWESREISTKNLTYAARFEHARERQAMLRAVRLVEYPEVAQPSDTAQLGGREPKFFSGNISSLSYTLGQVESESILVRDEGDRVIQTVTYRLAK